MREIFNSKVIAWAMYDWANSAYATVVLAGFFPIFFKSYWSGVSEPTESTFYLGLANSASGIVIVLLAPVLGAIADVGGVRKYFLFIFTLLGICATGSLFFVGQGEMAQAISFYMLAYIGYLGSMVFYDALLIEVTDEKNYNMVSAFGYALGYLGGGILFSVTVAMTLWPQWFGLQSDIAAVKLSFVAVAAWWLVFAIPVMLKVPEKKPKLRAPIHQLVAKAFSQLYNTFSHIRTLRVLFMFLLAYWLYIDGVDTIIVMAADYGASLGFSHANLITALLITQFIGFPAAIIFGMVGNRIGNKTAVLFGIMVYLGVTVWAYWMDTVSEFYLLAIVIGLVQGGVQSLSRSIFARMVPAGKSAEFFGFYNMVGKFAAILGPFIVAVVGKATGDPRVAIVSISVLFVAGGLLLYFVDIESSAAHCQQSK